MWGYKSRIKLVKRAIYMHSCKFTNFTESYPYVQEVRKRLFVNRKVSYLFETAKIAYNTEIRTWSFSQDSQKPISWTWVAQSFSSQASRCSSLNLHYKSILPNKQKCSGIIKYSATQTLKCTLMYCIKQQNIIMCCEICTKKKDSLKWQKWRDDLGKIPGYNVIMLPTS